MDAKTKKLNINEELDIPREPKGHLITLQLPINRHL